MTNWEILSEKHPEFRPWPNPFADNGMLHGFQPFAGARVMDIGANIGMVTAFCALNGARVESYEADSVTYSVLSDMVIGMNLSDKVKLYNKAIWIESGKCSFHGFTSNDGGNLSHNGALTDRLCPDNGKFRDAELVNCISLNDAIGSEIWDCIKIDVEGAEFEILLNADSERLEKQVKMIYVEFHHGWAESGLYGALLQKLTPIFDFDGVRIENGMWDYAVLRNKQLN